MQKTLKIDSAVHAKLLTKKAQIQAVNGENLTFSDLVGLLLENDT